MSSLKSEDVSPSRKRSEIDHHADKDRERCSKSQQQEEQSEENQGSHRFISNSNSASSKQSRPDWSIDMNKMDG